MDNNELYNIKDVIDYQINRVARGRALTYQEKYQIAYIGYLKAQGNFDPSYGRMSLTYATKYIRQELTRAVRKEYRYSNKKSKKITVTEDNELLNYLENQPDTSIPNPTTNPKLARIKELLHELNKQEQEIIIETFFAKKPKRLKDLSKKMGVSKQRIHQIKKEGLRKIKELLDE